MNLSAGNIIAGLIFSGIGYVAFSWGRKQERYRTMVMGIVLMAYPYFTPSTTMTCVVGVVLTVALYFFHD